MHIGLINSYDILLFIQLDFMEIRTSPKKLLMETCKAPHVHALFDHGSPSKIHIHFVSWCEATSRPSTLGSTR
jgi:hypothetical protein